MKTSAETKRINNKASHTALIAAIYRFLASKERRLGFTGPDNMAYMFLPLKARFFLSFDFFRNLFKKKLGEESPGSYEYVIARTRFFDDLFIQALKTHIPQIVILGAGYDTRAIRFQELLNGTRIFELDVPTTQNEKIKLLRKSKTPIPENIHFVTINFDRDDLKQILFRAGYDPTGRSMFIWEGVTMYITEEAVNRTLTFVRYNSGPGSNIAFDYLYKSVIQGRCSYYGAGELTEIAKKGGEALSFGIEEGEIEEFLASKGFTPLVHYSPQLLEAKYLYDENGGFFGNIYGFACNVHARISAANKKHTVN